MLNPDEKRRLEINDVRLKACDFSATEDEQLRNNWIDYCEISGVDPGEVFTYMGVANDKERVRSAKYFRAWMCRGLPDRSGIQVYRRCQVIFNPAIIEDGLAFYRPWSKNDLKELLELGPTAKWTAIGIRLKRDRYECFQKYRKLINEGIFTGDDESDDWNLFYKIISKAFRKDPVKAFVVGEFEALGQTLDWDQIGELMCCSPKRCRKLFKKLKKLMVEAKGDTTKSGNDQVKKIRRNLPKPCRRICRIQNKRKPALRIEPKVFSKIIKTLSAHHEEELKYMKPPYHFAATFIASETLGEYSEEHRRAILRRLNYVMYVFQDRGVFDFLPRGDRDTLMKLEMVAYVMKKVCFKSVEKARAFKLAKRFVEKQGIVPDRIAFAHKPGGEKVKKPKKKKPRLE
ncbi:hypothetical protein M3Y97_00047000 [Aphelenchoides bicaudatus]|nr:hypothetical protein M3Y97_00047000 [Aphelenchoides bicaudatus]